MPMSTLTSPPFWGSLVSKNSPLVQRDTRLFLIGGGGPWVRSVHCLLMALCNSHGLEPCFVKEKPKLGPQLYRCPFTLFGGGFPY